MPTVGSDSNYLSELVSGPMPFNGFDNAGGFHTAVVKMFSATEVEIDPVGTPVIWSAATDGGSFVPYVAQDISAVTSSGLPNDAPIAIVIGPDEGAGMQTAPIVLEAGVAQNVMVVFRGPFAVKVAGMSFGASTEGQITAFRTQLEKQDIKVKDAATVVDPTIYDIS